MLLRKLQPNETTLQQKTNSNSIYKNRLHWLYNNTKNQNQLWQAVTNLCRIWPDRELTSNLPFHMQSRNRLMN